jgi:thioredoxin-related protein
MLNLAGFILLLAPLSGCTRSDAAPDQLEPAMELSTELTWMEFEDALTTAQAEGKKMMVFLYTDWCPYCRRMMNEVHTDEAIIAYLNQHYTVAKLNSESTDPVQFRGMNTSQAALAGSFGTTGVPQTIFLNEKGEYITPVAGFVPAEGFITMLKYIAEDAYLEQNYQDYLSNM